MVKKPILLFFCWLAALAPSGCRVDPHTVAEKYYLVVSNMKSPFFEQVSAGLNQAASELKVHAALLGPETYDPQGQKQDFRRIAATRPAGILVSVADPRLLTEDIDAAIAAGIPVITVDSDAPSSKRLFFVGTNNYEAGQMGAREAARHLNGKGNVVAFLTAGQPNLEERLSGYRSVFEAHPQIKITEVVDLKGDPLVAFDKAKELLEKGRPVDAFISMEGQSAKEVAEVLVRNKASKVVISMDALAPTLDGIEKGVITATVAQKPFTIGYTGLRLMADLRLYKLPSLTLDFARDPNSRLPRFVDTGAALVDKSNVAAYREAGKRAGGGN
ncbi:MAG: substrate-binding domain-containing protein [Acidobacteria bacterium]|nr:substrate-binding domain-containing protein [Acidobacteriota bacterium]